MTGVFTNNWKGIKNRMLLGHCASAAGLDTVYNAEGDLVGAAMNSSQCYALSPLGAVHQGYSIASNSRNAQVVVRFGTSDTAPTADDIDLGNPWSSGISYVSAVTGAASVSGGSVSRTVTVTVQNTAAAAVTVREFGLFVYVKANTNEGIVMLYRAVLDEPVTIAQYESATLTYTVTVTLSDPG